MFAGVCCVTYMLRQKVNKQNFSLKRKQQGNEEELEADPLVG